MRQSLENKQNPIDESIFDIFELDMEGVDLTERLFLTLNEQAIIVLKVKEKLYAIGDICSHDDGPLDNGLIEDHCIVCPRHGAEFDIRSGKALTMPAIKDIPSYPVYQVGNTLFIGMKK
jgi:3-phenylpropionate/trans-cinnamate dioxygenase ferredoxin subunit